MNKWIIEYRLSNGSWNLVAGENSLAFLDKPELIRLANSIIQNGNKHGIEYRLRNLETEEKMNEEQIRESALPPLERH